MEVIRSQALQVSWMRKRRILHLLVKKEKENLEQNRTSFLGIEELGRTPPDVSLRVCFGRSLSAGRRLHASATRILAEVGRSDDVFSGFDGNH